MQCFPTVCPDTLVCHLWYDSVLPTGLEAIFDTSYLQDNKLYYWGFPPII